MSILPVFIAFRPTSLFTIMKWFAALAFCCSLAMFGIQHGYFMRHLVYGYTTFVSDKPLLIVVPYTAQLNAAASRYTEVLHLLKTVGSVDRAIIEPLSWAAPFDDLKFEQTLKDVGANESMKYVRYASERKKLLLGQQFEGIGRYFDLSRLQSWLGASIVKYSAFGQGSIIDIDLMLVFCDRVQPEFFRDYHKVTENLTLRIWNRMCYDDIFNKTCKLPSVEEFRNIAIMPMKTGSSLYKCVGPPVKKYYGLMTNRTRWLYEARKYVRWSPRLYAKAYKFQQTHLPGKYVAAHWRRGDKLIEKAYSSVTPDRLARAIGDMIDAAGGTSVVEYVFLATNSGSPDDVERLKRQLPLPIVTYPYPTQWQDSVDHSVIEQILCSEADWFLGAPSRWEATSAFTRFVMDERTLIGKGSRATFQSALSKPS